MIFVRRDSGDIENLITWNYWSTSGQHPYTLLASDLNRNTGSGNEANSTISYKSTCAKAGMAPHGSPKLLRYSQLEREMLGVVFAITRFRQYVLGRPFEVITYSSVLSGNHLRRIHLGFYSGLINRKSVEGSRNCYLVHGLALTVL